MMIAIGAVYMNDKYKFYCTPSSLLVKRKSRKVRMDSGRDPIAGFFSGLIVIGIVNIWCTKRSGPYIY